MELKKAEDIPLIKRLDMVVDKFVELKKKEIERERREYSIELFKLLNDPGITRYMPKLESFIPDGNDPRRYEGHYQTKADGSVRRGLDLVGEGDKNIVFTDDKELVYIQWYKESYNYSIHGIDRFYGVGLSPKEEKCEEHTIEEISKRKGCKEIFKYVIAQIVKTASIEEYLDGNIIHKFLTYEERLIKPDG